MGTSKLKFTLDITDNDLLRQHSDQHSKLLIILYARQKPGHVKLFTCPTQNQHLTWETWLMLASHILVRSFISLIYMVVNFLRNNNIFCALKISCPSLKNKIYIDVSKTDTGSLLGADSAISQQSVLQLLKLSPIWSFLFIRADFCAHPHLRLSFCVLISSFSPAHYQDALNSEGIVLNFSHWNCSPAPVET